MKPRQKGKLRTENLFQAPRLMTNLSEISSTAESRATFLEIEPIIKNFQKNLTSELAFTAKYRQEINEMQEQLDILESSTVFSGLKSPGPRGIMNLESKSFAQLQKPTTITSEAKPIRNITIQSDKSNDFYSHAVNRYPAPVRNLFSQKTQETPNLTLRRSCTISNLEERNRGLEAKLGSQLAKERDQLDGVITQLKMTPCAECLSKVHPDYFQDIDLELAKLQTKRGKYAQRAHQMVSKINTEVSVENESRNSGKRVEQCKGIEKRWLMYSLLSLEEKLLAEGIKQILGITEHGRVLVELCGGHLTFPFTLENLLFLDRLRSKSLFELHKRPCGGAYSFNAALDVLLTRRVDIQGLDKGDIFTFQALESDYLFSPFGPKKANALKQDPTESTKSKTRNSQNRKKKSTKKESREARRKEKRKASKKEYQSSRKQSKHKNDVKNRDNWLPDPNRSKRSGVLCKSGKSSETKSLATLGDPYQFSKNLHPFMSKQTPKSWIIQHPREVTPQCRADLNHLQDVNFTKFCLNSRYYSYLVEQRAATQSIQISRRLQRQGRAPLLRPPKIPVRAPTRKKSKIFILTCHHCSRRGPRSEFVECHQKNFFPKVNVGSELLKICLNMKSSVSVFCSKTFCRECVQGLYKQKLHAGATPSNWICPYCRGICYCVSCENRSLYTRLFSMYSRMGGDVGLLRGLSPAQRVAAFILQNEFYAAKFKFGGFESETDFVFKDINASFRVEDVLLNRHNMFFTEDDFVKMRGAKRKPRRKKRKGAAVDLMSEGFKDEMFQRAEFVQLILERTGRNGSAEEFDEEEEGYNEGGSENAMLDDWGEEEEPRDSKNSERREGPSVTDNQIRNLDVIFAEMREKKSDGDTDDMNQRRIGKNLMSQKKRKGKQAKSRKRKIRKSKKRRHSGRKFSGKFMLRKEDQYFELIDDSDSCSEDEENLNFKDRMFRNLEMRPNRSIYRFLKPKGKIYLLASKPKMSQIIPRKTKQKQTKQNSAKKSKARPPKRILAKDNFSLHALYPNLSQSNFENPHINHEENVFGWNRGFEGRFLYINPFGDSWKSKKRIMSTGLERPVFRDIATILRRNSVGIKPTHSKLETRIGGFGESNKSGMMVRLLKEREETLGILEMVTDVRRREERKREIVKKNKKYQRKKRRNRNK